MAPTCCKPVIVIGSGRSGTSLVARLLAGNGIFMGADVESNHESRSLQAVNRWILQNAGASIETAGRGDVDRLSADAFLASAVTQVVRAHVEGWRAWRYWGWRLARRPRRWGFKDPRTTFTLPFWLCVWPDAQVIHVLRNGLEVAASLVERRRRVEARWLFGRAPVALVRQHRAVANLRAASIEDAVEWWREYAERADQQVRALGPRAITVRFERLVRDPIVTLDELSAFLGQRLRLPFVLDTGRTGHVTDPALHDRHRLTLAPYGY